MKKTNTGLVEYCRAQLGRPYWMGTFGQTASEWIYNYNKQRLPPYYTEKDFTSQYGQRVHDCIGLIKGYLWSDGPDSPPVYVSTCPDISADEMRKRCDAQDIGTLPEEPGVLVFYAGHVGVYIGGGEVIEARGHSYGVVKTKLKDRPWKWWGRCPYIEYESAADDPATVWAKRCGVDVSDLGRSATLGDIIKLFYKGYQL